MDMRNNKRRIVLTHTGVNFRLSELSSLLREGVRVVNRKIRYEIYWKKPDVLLHQNAL